MAELRRWWCVIVMENLDLEGHGRKFAHWTDMAKAVVMGKLQPVFRIPRKRKLEQIMQEHAYTKKAEKHHKLETRPESFVILSDGDAAYLTLALTCTALRDVVSSLEFRHRAHYAWLESVVNVRKLPQAVRDMCVPYKIIECRNCKCFFKNWVGYCGNGRRGELRGFYSDTEFPEHCPDCQF
ncbi:uncharacterized protein [Misgurnus anguillicaudatus]